MTHRLTRYCACGTALVLNNAVDADPRDSTPVIEAFLDVHRGRDGHGEVSQQQASFQREVAEADRREKGVAI